MENRELKAEKMWFYAQTNAPNLAAAVLAFNNCASQIKTKTITELYALIDGELS